MKKVLVIGCPGSGKSTFSRKLRDALSLPLYYLDTLWYKPDGTGVSNEEFDRRLNEVLVKDKWIIDGNYKRTLEKRLNACDTVFLFDLPVSVCLLGAESRIGKKREDLPWKESEFDPEFKQYIIDFPEKQLPIIYSMLEKYKGKKICIFKSHGDADSFIKNLSESAL